MSTRVYLDHHAASPLAPEAREALGRAHERGWANASSAHEEGRHARTVLEDARRAVAHALGASAADVVLTGGGTEACNLGVLGAAVPGCRVVTSSLEHPAIAEAVAQLAASGHEVHTLPLHRREGLEALTALRALPHAERTPWLLATHVVGHEAGQILDLDALTAALPPDARVVLDACQALGKLPAERFVRPQWLVAIAGAKLGATAGSGALLVPRDVALSPRLLGGAQERGRRAGTPDVAAHAALGAACHSLPRRLASMASVAALRDRLEHALVTLGGVVNGAQHARVATVTNVSFRGWRKATLVAALDLEGVAVSAGAACSSGLDGPSSIIAALHPDEPWRAQSCVRFSLGPETREGDIERAIAAATRVLARSPG